jgi:hypothetical protein
MPSVDTIPTLHSNLTVPAAYSSAWTSSTIDTSEQRVVQEGGFQNTIGIGFSVGSLNSTTIVVSRERDIASGFKPAQLGWTAIPSGYDATMLHRLDAVERATEHRFKAINERLDYLQRAMETFGEAVWLDPQPPASIYGRSITELNNDQRADLFDYIADTGELTAGVSLELIKAGLQSPDPALRSASARALRVVDPVDAVSILTALEEGEHSPFVKAAFRGVIRALSKT